MMNLSEEIKNTIISKLEEIATPEKKKRERAFFKYTISNILGTGIKPMRVVVGKLSPILKTATEDEIIGAAEGLVETGIYEAQMAAVEMLFLCRDSINLDRIFDLGKNWIETGVVCNWATVDDIAEYLMGYAIMGNPEHVITTYKWTKSQNHWLRRASLVAYIIPARESLYYDRIYKTAKKLMNDSNVYVLKAIGWVLREAGETDKRRLENFIFKYGKDMRRVSLRSAIGRFPPAERAFIMEQTKTANYLEEQFKNEDDEAEEE